MVTIPTRRVADQQSESEMSEHEKQSEVRIHINREAYRSPNPTTGDALYDLGEIGKHEKLYRETEGNAEDHLIHRNDHSVHLVQDDHFYSQKATIIFVNGDEHETEKEQITYLQVVELFLGSGGQPSNEYLVKYSHGPSENPRGTLAPGQKVKVKDDMRFRVAGTGES
ncbi:multiubiquitin domain-containing protein [Novosphingobium sp. MD-1]|uniref:multiubiquitin domain-containing protein n=1 Tax=Novosphingobium sp. MD-1 TaxID=1630648 RepID=UPI000F7E31CB|nr:multiubiquitin domain-containing protein [Novosphingobium sp. MD-1]